ncbi:MAG TPA: hypothetical protein VNQ78_06230 [Paracoccus sp. (in: a-proteobacteria)]|uniref:hypothetical protein n=1 Tax=Paracoccus sp. TaxID=267 RepID=UPI002B779E93|nr:hypothetical protein [Paracoccus sp. (in: a-proteobacteria)]HWL56260.1 hypothetical protein [Paracoccus sp. (in: a-proteobacteria)]
MDFIRQKIRKRFAATALAIGTLCATPTTAQDALAIDKDGIHAGANLNFGNRLAPLITLWNPTYTIGIQPGTMYLRTNKRFIWYQSGTHSNTEFDAGGGTTLMTLSAAPAADKGTLDVNGLITGKGAVPVGAILMWSGDPSKLPAGWVLCDGQNNTPNLLGRFIVGYQPGNPDYAVGKTGGAEKHTLTLAEMPAHNHGEAGEHRHSLWASGHGWAFPVVQTGDTRVKNDSHFVTTDAAGKHTHNTEGGGQPHENRPPYYALAYIMFTGK